MADTVKSTIAVKRVETQLLEEFLKTVEVGQVVPYDKLSEICSTDVTTNARAWLQTARKNVEAELKTCFATIVRVGIKRLSPAEHAVHISGDRKRAGKRAKKAFNKSFNVKWDALAAEEKVRVNLERTVLQFMADSARDNAVKKLTKKVKDSNHALPSKEALKALADNF